VSSIRAWIALSLIVALFPGVATAQLQRWVDDEGTIHYTAPPGERDPLPPRGVKIPFSAGSPILLQAKINGVGAVLLILDTGAERTMVRPESLWKLGIPTHDARPHRIRGVGGTVQAAGMWVQLVEVGETRVGPLFLVLHDVKLRQADGLLGRDFLDHFTVTIDVKEGVVTLETK
jgi:hypothetical protein